MPIDLYRNQQIYNMVAEGEIAELLSKFNTDYIIDTITTNINNRFQYNTLILKPNIISSFELNFKDLVSTYPSDAENIMQVRYETYQNIINIICNAFNLQYNGNDPDRFSLAYNLYDFLISGYSRNIINFFAKYIYNNKDMIYEAMDLDKYKRNKNSSVNYIKKIYNDNNIAIIISRIKDVIYYISGFDIDMYTFLSYNYDKATCDFIYNNVVPLSNIFKEEFCQCLNNPMLLTDIRLELQKLCPMNNQSVINDIIGDPSNEEEEDAVI